MDTLREWMTHFAGTFWKLLVLWNGSTVWKNMGQDHGVAYIYYHPDGGYFVGSRLIAPLEVWHELWATAHSMEEWPSLSVHVHLFVWETLPEVPIPDKRVTAQVKELEDKLEESRQQLEVATSMLQAEWDPMQVETGAASSGDFVFVHPTAKAAAKAKSMPEAPAQVTWIHLCSYIWMFEDLVFDNFSQWNQCYSLYGYLCERKSLWMQFSLSLLAAHHIEISCCGYSYWQSKLFIVKKIKKAPLKTLQPLSYCVGVFSEVLFWILNLWKIPREPYMVVVLNLR